MDEFFVIVYNIQLVDFTLTSKTNNQISKFVLYEFWSMPVIAVFRRLIQKAHEFKVSHTEQ